jgi:class 3 adenylate cyclase
LMNRATKNQIIVSESIQQAILSAYECMPLGEISLKGKSAPMPIFDLAG